MNNQRKQHIESCKEANVEFIAQYKPVIIYVREPGHVEWKSCCPTTWHWCKGKPIGVVIAYENSVGNMYVGWSKLHHLDNKRWNKQQGLNKAFANAVLVDHVNPHRSMVKAVDFVINRAKVIFENRRKKFHWNKEGTILSNSYGQVGGIVGDPQKMLKVGDILEDGSNVLAANDDNPFKKYFNKFVDYMSSYNVSSFE